MGDFQGTFKRYEKKYLLSEMTYKLLRQRLRDKMNVDQYGKITICNIYFDTPSRELIRTSLEGPLYKEKLRLRSYGTPKSGDDTVFIELKKKYKGVVYKRREKLNLRAAESYLYDSKNVGQSSQVMKEIDWFKKFYQGLEPAMYISYDRVALYGVEDSEVRITFDSNILWREEELRLEKGIWGNELLKRGEQLMEIKIPGVMPLWLSQILDDLKIYPASFSKYGKGYTESITSIKNINRNGEIKYA